MKSRKPLTTDTPMPAKKRGSVFVRMASPHAGTIPPRAITATCTLAARWAEAGAP